MIDKAIEMLDGRNRMVRALGTGRVGLEIMKERPASDLQIGGEQMPMKEPGAEQTASEGFHMAVNHITGTMGVRIVEGEGKARRFRH